MRGLTPGFQVLEQRIHKGFPSLTVRLLAPGRKLFSLLTNARRFSRRADGFYEDAKHSEFFLCTGRRQDLIFSLKRPASMVNDLAVLLV